MITSVHINRIKSYLLLVIAFTSYSFGNPLWAQEYLSYIQQFDASNGYGSNVINKFFEDSEGLIWVGTENGLNCYDGAQFKSYTAEDGLAHNYIQDIHEDNLGNIWIQSGEFASNDFFVSFFDKETGQILPLQEYLTSSFSFKSQFIRLHNQSQGVNIISERHKGSSYFYELDNKTVKPIFAVPDTLGKNPTVKLAIKTKNNRYRVLMCFADIIQKNKYCQLFEYDPNINRLELIEEERHSELRSSNFSKYFYYPDNFARFDSLVSEANEIFNDSSQHTKIQYISNNELILVHNQKIIYFDLLSFKMTKVIPVSENIVSKLFNPYLYADKKGGFWYRNGNFLERLHFEKNKFEGIVGSKNKAIRGVLMVDEDLYFSAYGELLVHSNGQTQNCELFDDILEFVTGVNGFVRDGDYLWIASESDLLIKYSISTREKEFYRFTDKKRHFSWKPFIDKNNQIWLGSKGLYKVNQKRKVIEAFETGDFTKLNDTVIYSFHNSDEGTWLCTSNGLFLVDLPSKSILEHHHNSQLNNSFLPLNICLHLYQDKNDVFWIATKGNGLVKWDTKTGNYKSFTTKNSEITNDIIYGVYEDNFNNLWLPSNYGLMNFDKENESVSTFYLDNGISNNEFNTISHFQDKNGDLYFGSVDGLIRFNPSDFENEQEATTLELTDVTRLDENLNTISILNEVSKDQIIPLCPTERYIDLEFKLASFNKSGKTRYSHRILGYQDKWVYSEKGNLRLSGLPYGEYMLEVRAKQLDSKNWTSYKNGIKVLVSKPFYLRWWFVLLALFFLVFLVYWIVQWNTYQYLERQNELEKVVLERTEEIRKQSEELKELDKVKTNFFANISHELRTPLTLILGPLSYILDNPNKLEEEEIRMQHLVMKRNGTNLMHLIEEILDLSKIEAKKLSLKEDVTNVQEFFEYVFYMFEPQFESLGIHARIESTVQGDLHIWMDRNKMEKVLNNFISNAIKFTPRRETIILRLATMDNVLKIEVEDSGAGIHQSDMPHIFDRFFQSKQGDKKLHGGTGIGLALVKEFAELMNAEVYATSELGKGSIFSFNLPYRNAPKIDKLTIDFALPENDDENDTVLHGQEYTILLVEDNIDMRGFISGLLNNEYNTIY